MDWLKAAANRSQSQPAKSRSSRRTPQQPPAPAPSRSNDDLPSSSSTSPRSARLKSLAQLSNQLHQLKHSFQPPPTLTFQPNATASNPKLDFTANNAPVLGYDEALLKLMIQLDAVESEGDQKVREERKRVVNLVDRELAWLDRLKREAWENGGRVTVQKEEEEVGEKESKMKEQKDKVDRMLQSAGATPTELNRSSQNSNGKRVDHQFPSQPNPAYHPDRNPKIPRHQQGATPTQRGPPSSSSRAPPPRSSEPHYAPRQPPPQQSRPEQQQGAWGRGPPAPAPPSAGRRAPAADGQRRNDGAYMTGLPSRFA
ncbi:hypothetical protein BCR35DRAFT_298142 [Leucosporidium creatinivorum]|uniref:BAG domain-containing protein n=1 Tax=Leucosporidium creatinivorum TaxID=106004 RepID=A0A1Y2G579_9BASI|nr:hypothetical protein BCR35DRAFT_298142 [Leucosporidium creatinivorum]